MLEIKVDVSQDKKIPSLSKGQVSKLTRSLAARIRQAVMAATPLGSRPLDMRQDKRTKASWTPVTKDEGGYSFYNPLVQAYFLEHGSKIGERPWPSVPEKRPRTVYFKGRVYSSQAPEGITAKANVNEIADQIAGELFDLLVKGKSLAKR